MLLTPLPVVITWPVVLRVRRSRAVPYWITDARVAASVRHRAAIVVAGDAGHVTCTAAGVAPAPKVVLSPRTAVATSGMRTTYAQPAGVYDVTISCTTLASA